jgi:hypothetical protein
MVRPLPGGRVELRVALNWIADVRLAWSASDERHHGPWRMTWHLCVMTY